MRLIFRCFYTVDNYNICENRPSYNSLNNNLYIQNNCNYINLIIEPADLAHQLSGDLSHNAPV